MYWPPVLPPPIASTPQRKCPACGKWLLVKQYYARRPMWKCGICKFFIWRLK